MNIEVARNRAGVKLTAVVAMTPERVIGKNGTLPWHLPEDLKFFKRTTSGHPVVMGRKTFESIGKPLPKRRNIILSRDKGWEPPGAEVIHSPEDLLELPELSGQIYVIGGAQIYEAFRPFLDDWLVSHLNGNFLGDTWLEEFENDFPVSEVIERFDDFEVKRWRKA